jgi:hypothetical protein
MPWKRKRAPPPVISPSVDSRGRKIGRSADAKIGKPADDDAAPAS